MAILLPIPKWRFLSHAGTPLAGGYVEVYNAGTDVHATTYTTQAGTVAQSWPVVLDAYGEATIYFPTTACKVKVYDSTGQLQWTEDNVQDSIAGLGVPGGRHVALGVAPTANSVLIVRSDSDYETIASTVQIQRYARVDEGFVTPTALRVFTEIGSENGMGEWAISAEMHNYSNIDRYNGNTAISGTHRKYGSQGGCFAGHFNSMEMYTRSNPADNTGSVTMEVDINAFGADNPTFNNGYGLRWGIALNARTTQSAAPGFPVRANSTAYEVGDQVVAPSAVQVAGTEVIYYICTVAGTSGSDAPAWSTTIYDTFTDGGVTWEVRKGAECGTAIIVQNNHGDTSWGYWRYGIVIREMNEYGNPNTINTALKIATSGDYGIYISGAKGVADVYIGGGGTNGLVLAGEYTAAAIRIPEDQHIGLNNSDSVRLGYVSASARVKVLSGSTERVGFSLTSTPAIFLNGTQVLAPRRTGWSSGGPTPSRAALAVSGNTGDDCAAVIRAIVEDLMAHGLFGA